MTITRRTALAGGSLLTSASIFRSIPFTAAQPVDAGGAPEPATGPLDTAIEAYVYGYPLVTMEMTRRVLTNVEKPEGLAAPMGQFVNLREYPNATFKRVTAPNADTLYSSSFIDVSKEPFILQVPDEHGRYYLVPMYEAWTNIFADPGTRTTGTAAGEFAIVGPNWRGDLPPGVEQYRSSTNLVWLIGRTYCTGTPEDYAAVHAIQDQYKLVPLSAYGMPYTPPVGKVDPTIEMNVPPREQVERMDAISFFNLLADTLAFGSHRPRTRAGLRYVEARVYTQLPRRAEARRRAHHGALRRRRVRCKRLDRLQARRNLWHRLHPTRTDHALFPWL
jgi:hypothetical protein